MKTISKRPIKQLSKIHSMKKVYFDQSETIIEQGHFIKPSTIVSYSNKNIHIICKGYGKDAVLIANEVLNYIKQPILSLVNDQSKLNNFCKRLDLQNLSQESKQRYLMLNLIDSCFQQLGMKKIDGSCSFGISYLINDKLFIVKNKMIECYSITQKEPRKQLQFKSICSKQLPFQLNSVSQNLANQNCTSKQTKGFLVCDKNYDNITSRKYFPEVQFLSMNIPKNQNILFLMGNSQCFCHFSEDEVINFFKTYSTLNEAGRNLLQSSKKKWKTIYQEDMILIVSVFSRSISEDQQTVNKKVKKYNQQNCNIED